MYYYNIVDQDNPSSSTFITLGSTSYPAKFEETLGSYNVLRGDINTASAGALDLTEDNWFAHTNAYVLKFKSSLQTQADFDGDNKGADLYEFRTLIPAMQDGSALNGGDHESVLDELDKVKMGFSTPQHIYTDLNPSLAQTIQTIITENPGLDPDTINLYLEYDNETGEWAWSTSAGIAKPEPDIDDGHISTENAVPTWTDEYATGFNDTRVIITEDDEMHGQGVLIYEVFGSFELSDIHRGKVLKYPKTDEAGGEITTPLVTVANKMKGFQCTIINSGTGPVGVVPGASTTLDYKLSAGNPEAIPDPEYPYMDGQHSAVSIINLSTDEWGVYGDLALVDV